MTKKVSIVIVNYNVKDLLESCLNSIAKFCNPNFIQVLVVDNASIDGSVEMIRKKFPNCKIIENSINLGFPKANNQAFGLVETEFILMLNPDTEFIDDSLSMMIEYLEFHPDIWLLAPELLNSDGTHQSSTWRFPNLLSVFCEMFYLKIFTRKKNYFDKDFKTFFFSESVSGAAILFKTELLIRIGNLDEKLFWIEDVDFCLRANKLGYQLIYFPESRIIHHSGQSAKKDYRISISNQVINKIKFFKKHHNYFEFLLIVIFSLIHCLLKLFVFSLLSFNNKLYAKKAKAYMYTIPLLFKTY